MDGKGLVYKLRSILNEDSSSPFLDTRTAYEVLHEAATKLVERTSCMKGDETVTTVANQSTYDLAADFLKPYWRDRDNRLFLKYNDGVNTHTLYFRDYDMIRFDGNNTAVSIPSNFSIIDDTSTPARVTGTATSNGVSTAGESVLAGAGFSSVSPGDSVHNTTDGSTGIVSEATSATSLKTCLFGGTNNDWTSGDAYLVIPQARMALVLDPPPSTAGHIITIGKIQRPAPVYSDYGVYRIPQRFLQALVFYAAWLFKYRDNESDTGNQWYKFFDMEVRNAESQLNESLNRTGFTVNLKAYRGR